MSDPLSHNEMTAVATHTAAMILKRQIQFVIEAAEPTAAAVALSVVLLGLAARDGSDARDILDQVEDAINSDAIDTSDETNAWHYGSSAFN